MCRSGPRPGRSTGGAISNADKRGGRDRAGAYTSDPVRGYRDIDAQNKRGEEGERER